MKCFIQEDKISSGWEQLHLISIRTHAIIPPEEGEEERDRMWEQEEERKKRVERAVELWEKRNWEQVFLRMSGEGSHRVHTPHGGYIRARKRNDAVFSLILAKIQLQLR